MADYTELVEVLRECSKLGKRYGMAVIYMDKAAAAIEELSRENESLAASVNEASEILRSRKPRWIPVTERLPYEELLGILVLCCLKSKDVEWVDIRLFMDGKFRHPKGQKGKVTHWMPLPESPKEET